MRITNEWRSHVLDKLRRQIDIGGDPVLAELLHELSNYPVPGTTAIAPELLLDRECHRFVVPFQLVTETGILSFFTTTTVFGTPVDITLSELSLESFYPADSVTAEALQKAAALRSESNNLPRR